MTRPVFACVFALLGYAAQAQEFKFENLYYRVIDVSAYSVEVIAPNDTTDSYTELLSIHIPAYVEYEGVKYEVTSIGDYAFFKCLHMQNVNFPETTQRIGAHAFEGNHSLTSIIIPASVQFVDKNAFMNCFRLNSVEWNAINCTTTEYPVFYQSNNIESFTFGSSVERIPMALCYGLLNLDTISIPDKVTAIDDYAFAKCTGLKEVELPTSLKMLGEKAFYDCKNLSSISLPNQLISIGKDAFSFNEKLSSIVFPESLVEIGESAFSYCYSITEITIPKNVTKIGEHAFKYCYNLENVTWNANISISDTIDMKGEENYFFGEQRYSIHNKFQSITFGEEVKIIPRGIAYNLTHLTSVTFKGNVKKIESLAFACTHIREISLPNSLESIGCEAFILTGIESITIPENVKEIGSCAFCAMPLRNINWNARSCRYTDDELYAEPNGPIFGKYMNDDDWFFNEDSLIIRLVIGDSVQSLPDNMFRDLSFKKIYVGNSLKSVGSYTFSQCKINECIYNSHIFVYMPRNYIGSYSIPDGINVIGSNAFAGCKGLTELYIPESVEQIGDYAFAMAGVNSIRIPKNVTDIGVCVFASCNNLSEIVVDNSNKVFDSRERCNAIIHTQSNKLIAGCQNTFLPTSVQIIGKASFAYSKTPKHIKLPDNLLSIEDDAFYLSTIQSISIGRNVSIIGDGALWNCNELSQIHVDRGNKFYKSGIDNKTLTRMEDSLLIVICKGAKIPKYVQIIGKYAARCSKISTIVIPDNVIEIQFEAFAFCEQLQSIQFGNNLRTIGEQAFGYCTKLKSIVIPASVKTIGPGAFERCDNLKHCHIKGSEVNVNLGSCFWGCHEDLEFTFDDSAIVNVDN